MKNFEKLVSGYKRFLTHDFPDHEGRYQTLAADGQSPKIMVIGCSDSRVNPDLIFNSKPGDLFVVRNVANLVPPYQPDDKMHSTSAALEFAVKALKVDHIVVLGHSLCGGVKACCEAVSGGVVEGEFIPRWTSLLHDCAKGIQQQNLPEDEFSTAVEKAAVETSIANLKTFPFVMEAKKERGMILHGAYFDVRNAQLYALDHGSHEFLAVE
ncbi:MAG: carbonic anhydrase [Alphaproteobacteria bacterium]